MHDWFTVAEAAKLLNVTDRQVRYWINDGTLTAIILGPRKRVIRASSVLDLIETRANGRLVT